MLQQFHCISKNNQRRSNVWCLAPESDKERDWVWDPYACYIHPPHSTATECASKWFAVCHAQNDIHRGFNNESLSTHGCYFEFTSMFDVMSFYHHYTLMKHENAFIKRTLPHIQPLNICSISCCQSRYMLNGNEAWQQAHIHTHTHKRTQNLWKIKC